MFASRKLLLPAVVLGLASICLIFSYQTILIESGRFLAPEATGRADVVILEGTELIRERPVRIGMALLTSGWANRLALVVQQDVAGGQIFALQNYTRLIATDLEAFGLRKDQFQIIEVPANHPITLTEAQIVLTNLSRSGVRSAILIADGFHARRSFWAYKQVGTPLGVKIYLYPYFPKYGPATWWRTADGCYEFVTESFKLFYYVIMGYIPVKSLFAT